VNTVGYAVCRRKSRFRDWLVSEFPIVWGAEPDAVLYSTKGDAERIRRRIDGRTMVVDLRSTRPSPDPDT
jgi:hypothetical protein